MWEDLVEVINMELIGLLLFSLWIGFICKSISDDKTFNENHNRFMRKHFPNEGY